MGKKIEYVGHRNEAVHIIVVSLIEFAGEARPRCVSLFVPFEICRKHVRK
jgi:hypothetical protein